MTDAARKARANWTNYTQFRFESENEIDPAVDPGKGTVIFDWNLPGSDASVEYL